MVVSPVAFSVVPSGILSPKIGSTIPPSVLSWTTLSEASSGSNVVVSSAMSFSSSTSGIILGSAVASIIAFSVDVASATFSVDASGVLSPKTGNRRPPSVVSFTVLSVSTSSLGSSVVVTGIADELVTDVFGRDVVSTISGSIVSADEVVSMTSVGSVVTSFF